MDIDRSHLRDSRPLQWDRAARTPAAKAAIEALLASLEALESRGRRRRPADAKRLLAALEAAVMDLYAAALTSPSLWLAYSRNRNDYGRGRYRAPGGTVTAATTAADYLIRAGYAEGRKGSYTRQEHPFLPGESTGRGYLSRLRATPALVELLRDRHGLTAADIGFAPWSEAIRLKGPASRPRGPKPLLEYEDTDFTRAARAALVAINALIAGARIELVGPEPAEESTAEDPAEDIEDRPAARDRAAVRLHRVFNNGRWDHGGRFYGGWWQSLSKDCRRRLLINGERTVELDYSALHPRLCYALEGRPLPEDQDPYAIEGMEGEERRQLVKRAFNALLNVPPGVTPKAPPGAAKVLPKGLSYRKLLQRIEAAHPMIAGWFRGGRGMELQWLDSEIAGAVLSSFAQRGVPCLPVHDSFIVPASLKSKLREAMREAYSDVVTEAGRSAAPPPISGSVGAT